MRFERIRVLCLDISGIDGAAYETMYSRASLVRRDRADRCLRREDKVRCIAADALLRYGLARAGLPRDMEPQRDGCGKPYFKNAEGFRFNLSHSGRWVVLAFGGSEVDIDVEQLHMDAGKENIARRYFTADEQDYVFEREEGRAERFFRVWTAKESYLKYKGTGLRVPLDSFSVLTMVRPSFYHWCLEEACLTLCTTEEEPVVERVDVESLIRIGT